MYQGSLALDKCSVQFINASMKIEEESISLVADGIVESSSLAED